MNSIPQVPTSQFSGTKAKKLDGRKARRKRYVVIELAPRKAKGRMPRKAFGKPMPYVESVVLGDRIFDHGPIEDPRNDPYLKA